VGEKAEVKRFCLFFLIFQNRGYSKLLSGYFGFFPVYQVSGNLQFSRLREAQLSVFI